MHLDLLLQYKQQQHSADILSIQNFTQVQVHKYLRQNTLQVPKVKVLIMQNVPFHKVSYYMQKSIKIADPQAQDTLWSAIFKQL